MKEQTFNFKTPGRQRIEFSQPWGVNAGDTLGVRKLTGSLGCLSPGKLYPLTGYPFEVSLQNDLSNKFAVQVEYTCRLIHRNFLLLNKCFFILKIAAIVYQRGPSKLLIPVLYPEGPSGIKQISVKLATDNMTELSHFNSLSKSVRIIQQFQVSSIKAGPLISGAPFEIRLEGYQGIQMYICLNSCTFHIFLTSFFLCALRCRSREDAIFVAILG